MSTTGTPFPSTSSHVSSTTSLPRRTSRTATSSSSSTRLLPADIYLIDEPSAHLDSDQRLVAAMVIKRFQVCGVGVEIASTGGGLRHWQSSRSSLDHVLADRRRAQPIQSYQEPH